MKKDTAITIIIILAGFVIFSIGIVSGDFVWSVIGGIIIILPPIILNIKRKREKKSFIHYVETEDKPILSSRKTREEFEIKEYWKRIRKFFEKTFIMIFIAGVALGLASIMMTKYVFEPSHVTLESALINGCAILNSGGCNKDPSEIIVNYDVNGDGIIGGIDDNLSNILERYNCTGVCIKRRCGCIGY